MRKSGRRRRRAPWRGQSAAAFATQHQISATRLSYWSKQLELQKAVPEAQRATAADETPQFVAVSVPAQTRAGHAIEVEVGGLTVRVREGADTTFVARLVRALQCGSVAAC